MKKVARVFFILISIVVVFSSCKRKRETCAAYNRVEHPQQK